MRTPDIPKQNEDAEFMSSRFAAIFLAHQQRWLALSSEAKKKKETKDVKAEIGIFILFGYKCTRF